MCTYHRNEDGFHPPFCRCLSYVPHHLPCFHRLVQGGSTSQLGRSACMYPSLLNFTAYFDTMLIFPDVYRSSPLAQVWIPHIKPPLLSGSFPYLFLGFSIWQCNILPATKESSLISCWSFSPALPLLPLSMDFCLLCVCLMVTDLSSFVVTDVQLSLESLFLPNSNYRTYMCLYDAFLLC